MVSIAAPTAAMPPPPTPLAKRPTMALKRDSSYLDTDDEADLTSTTKRLRVAFDDHVDVRILDDWTDKSYDLVKEEVRIAIQRHLAPADQRDDTQYVKLLETLGQDVLSGEAPSPKLLKRYVMALSSRVAELKDCGKLVSAVFDLPWLGRDPGFVDVYSRLLITLAGTYGKYITPMLERLVSHFERLPASTGRLPDEQHVITRAAMFDRIHGLLQDLVSRVPSAGGSLVRVLSHQFPNDMATAKGCVQYQKHLLRIAEDIPEMKAEIVALIMERLVGIDVQIQQDLEDLEDEEEDQLLQRPHPKSPAADGLESDDSDIESISESEMTTTEDEQRLRELRLKVAKMDGAQNLLFEFYEPYFNAEKRPGDNLAYQELLTHFTDLIMPNRSRHSQFLLFHFAQVSPSYADNFVQHCLHLAVNRNASVITRLTACAYVASFTARAAHMPAKSVRSVFDVLCQFLEQMRHRYEPTCAGPDRRSYSLYYAVYQALLYIFCFKWRDLVVGSTNLEADGDNVREEDVLADGRELTWLHGVKETISVNAHSVLNPLKVCSAAIVIEFAKIANHLRFLYVFSLLERNKRIRLGQTQKFFHFGQGLDLGRRETAWDRKIGDAHHQLEAYFPFDPYHLPQSKKWLEGEYNEWKLPRGMKQDDEDDDDDEVSGSGDEYDSDEDSLPEDVPVMPLNVSDTISLSS